MTIHLLNGDCAKVDFPLPGELLVWRENYLQGRIPGTDDPERFARLRAAELHPFAPEKPESEIQSELLLMHRRLTALRENDRLHLWFDFCPFDRVMLARIIYLLHRLDVRPEIRLTAEDVAWNREAFLRFRDAGRTLTAADLAFGAAEWTAYCDGAKPETLLSSLFNG